MLNLRLTFVLCICRSYCLCGVFLFTLWIQYYCYNISVRWWLDIFQNCLLLNIKWALSIPKKYQCRLGFIIQFSTAYYSASLFSAPPPNLELARLAVKQYHDFLCNSLVLLRLSGRATKYHITCHVNGKTLHLTHWANICILPCQVSENCKAKL